MSKGSPRPKHLGLKHRAGALDDLDDFDAIERYRYCSVSTRAAASCLSEHSSGSVLLIRLGCLQAALRKQREHSVVAAGGAAGQDEPAAPPGADAIRRCCGPRAGLQPAQAVPRRHGWVGLLEARAAARCAQCVRRDHAAPCAAPLPAEDGRCAGIAGAGLGGCLAAVVAARKGEHVEVFEYREDPRKEKTKPGRSINLYPPPTHSRTRTRTHTFSPRPELIAKPMAGLILGMPMAGR